MHMTKWITLDQKTFVEILPEVNIMDHYLGDECWCNPVISRIPGDLPIITHSETKRGNISI